MEQMIDKNLVKKLRNERSWSQEQLAEISGLSHRTVQRIEKDGRCSQDSRKALATAFEVNVNDLNIDRAAMDLQIANRRGRTYGFAGALIGLLCAYAGITVSFVSGAIGSSEAGLYYGAVGMFAGACCPCIGVLANKCRAGIS